MRRTLAWGAAIAALVAAALLVLTSGGSASPRGITQEETIVVIEKTTKGKAHYFGNTPFSPGDPYVFRSTLSGETGDQVGSLRVSCVVTFNSRDLCTGAYLLTGRGEIIATGTIPDRQLHLGGQWDLAIAGGSGDFENARGSVHVEQINANGDTRQTLHLIP